MKKYMNYRTALNAAEDSSTGYALIFKTKGGTIYMCDRPMLLRTTDKKLFERKD